MNCTILFLNICNQNFLFFQIKQLNKQLFDIPSTGCTKGNSLNWNVHLGSSTNNLRQFFDIETYPASKVISKIKLFGIQVNSSSFLVNWLLIETLSL